MAVFIGVALTSTAGWILSFLLRRSAARRHLVLLTSLLACLLLPIAWGVRSGTQWSLLVIRSAAPADESPASVSPPRTDRSTMPSLPRHAHSSIEAGTPLAASSPESDRSMADQIQTDLSSARPRQIEGSAAAPASTPASQQLPQQAAKPATTWASLKFWGFAIYLLVAGALGIRLLAGLLSVHRVKRRAVEVGSLPGGARVLEGDVACPIAIGFGQPAVVVPRSFRAVVREDELYDVLMHESEHLRRGDHWVILLQELAAAAYWPVLTVHLLNRALSRAREELCDNAVLATRDPESYCQTLLKVAQLALARRSRVPQLAPPVIRRGDLEHRVAGVLDTRRDRRSQQSRMVRYTAAAVLLLATVLAGTTRIVAVAGATAEPASELLTQNADQPPAPNDNITWTGIPTVDISDPTLHKGVVLAPDGAPLAGASIYAASTIELLQLAEAHEVSTADLGPVRAVTDAKGRFEFTAPDLTWVTVRGERKRWETLLVAVKDGLPPGWLKTWGADRTLRSHWHPSKDKNVAVRTRPPAVLTGQLQLAGGQPLAGARVRVTGLMAPREYDLSKHIPAEEENPLGMFQGVDYAETIYRPWVLPGLQTETKTDAAGNLSLPGLPEGFIAQVEITHPLAMTTTARVAIRSIDPVYRRPGPLAQEPRLSLYGSGFSLELQPGDVLRGRVLVDQGFEKPPAVGVIVARANQNAKDGMDGPRVTTDAQGRFELTGFRSRPEGYDLAFAGSFSAPVVGSRVRVVPGADARIELDPAVPYRLTLTDPSGRPVDRDVYSIVVQQVPGSRRSDMKSRFNDAERVAPGVYEGIVPIGPGAVLVKRGAKSDRPAAVDPKQFFAPGRTDWTLEEERHAYGDAWRIARPTVIYGYVTSAPIDQLELAAVVFTNARNSNEVLELSAIVHSDPPMQVTLVDESGSPVDGARLTRQLERYDGKDLPATFPVYGLHPQRAEFLQFTHEQRGLIGTLSTTWTGEPIQVVMRPAATLIGRITDGSGEPSSDFRIRVLGEQVMPDTYVAGRRFKPTSTPGERRGEFRLVVPPNATVRGEYVRKTPDWRTRPSAGTAFGPLQPAPGETVQLGDLVVP